MKTGRTPPRRKPIAGARRHPLPMTTEPKDGPAPPAPLNIFMTAAAPVPPALTLPAIMVKPTIAKHTVKKPAPGDIPDRLSRGAIGTFALGWALMLTTIAYAALQGARTDTYVVIIVMMIVSAAGGYWVGYRAEREMMAAWVAVTIIGSILVGIGVLAAAIFGAWSSWTIPMAPMLTATSTAAILGAYRNRKIRELQTKTG